MKLLTQNLFFLPIISNSTVTTGFYSPGVHMGRGEAIELMISFGTLGTASYTVTVGCSATAKSTVPDYDMNFRYALSAAAGTDTMGTLTNYTGGNGTSTPSSGVTITYTTYSNCTMIIDVSSEELAQGYPYLQVGIARGGSATATFICINGIYEPRYPQLSTTQGSGIGLFT